MTPSITESPEPSATPRNRAVREDKRAEEAVGEEGDGVEASGRRRRRRRKALPVVAEEALPVVASRRRRRSASEGDGHEEVSARGGEWVTGPLERGRKESRGAGSQR